MKAKGKGFLKVTSIIMLIFSFFSVISMGLSYYMTTMPEVSEVLDSMGLKVTAFDYILSIVSIVVQVAASIIGIRFCNRPEKGKTCFIWGVAMIAVQLISIIYTTVTVGFSIFTVILGLILPVLYLIGANKNMNMEADTVEVEEAE